MSNGKTRHRRAAAPALETMEDVEQCVGEIARLTIARDAVLAEMDGRLQAVRTEYEARLSDLTADLETEMGMAQEWAEANPQQFAARKSMDLTHGMIGFRTGTPKLKTLRGWTWDRVLERIKDAWPRYVRETAAVDKERILAERATLDLGAIGVQVAQDETFFVEVKREEGPK